MSVIKSVRNMRHEMNVPHNKKINLYIEVKSNKHMEVLRRYIDILLKLSGAKNVDIGIEFDIPQAVTSVNDYVKIYVPIDDLVDRDAEIARLEKEFELVRKQLEQVEKRLEDEKFISKAPQKIIDGAKKNAEILREKYAKIDQSIKKFR